MATTMLGGSVARSRIAVWGAAFKPDSDDVRDSPALSIAGKLHLRGASVVVYDPQADRDRARRSSRPSSTPILRSTPRVAPTWCCT